MAAVAKLKRLPAVLVDWLDILDGGSEWQEGTISPVRVRTVGFLLSESRKHIVLVRDYFDMDGKRTLGGRLAIPLGCIQKMTTLAPREG